MTASPPRRSSRAVQALLIALLMAMVGAIGWLFMRSERAQGEVAPHGDDLAQPGESPRISAGVRGRVWLEAVQEEPETPEASEQPAGPLTPASDCTVRAWTSGAAAAAPVECDRQGHFAVQGLSPGLVTFEIEAPGRLRAVVEVEVPATGEGVLPEVALGFAEVVSGHVRDARGEPLVDVVVEARPVPDLGEREPWRRRTDAAGFFEFDTLPPGPVALRAAPEGFEATVIEALAPARGVLLRLGALHDLRGRVLTAPLGPGAQVRVRLEGSGVWPAREVVAAADGGFVFTEVPDGVYAVEAIASVSETGAEADGALFASVPLEGVEPDLEVTLAMVPAHQLDVRVEAPDGTAIDGARVSLMNAHVGLLSRVATTGADGAARIGPVVPGPYVLRADADGYLASLPLAVQVGADSLEPQVLRLSRPAAVRGVVVDGEGEPVADARVRLRTDALFSVGEHDARARTFARTLRAAGSLGVTVGSVPPIPYGDGLSSDAAARTDADGRFSFSHLAPGQYRLQAGHESFAASDEADVTLRAGAQREVTLALRSGHRLTGRVVDGNDRPIEGARVTTDKHGQGWTDDRGVFDVGAHEGTVTLKVRAAGYGGARLRVRMQERAQDVHVELVEADAVLEGHVVDTNGRPIEGAVVTADVRGGLGESRRVWSDARGAWELEGLVVSELELSCTHPDYVEATTTARAGADDPVAFVLETGWSTTIVVRWSGTLEPVEGARVRALGGGDAVTTEASGEARFVGLAPGAVTLTVEHPNAPMLRRTIKQANAADREVVVSLVEGGALVGRVTDYRGDPVPAAEVAIILEGEREPFASLVTGARGRFSFEGVPQGALVVQAWPPTELEDTLTDAEEASDVLRGHTTQDVVVRLERR